MFVGCSLKVKCYNRSDRFSVSSLLKLRSSPGGPAVGHHAGRRVGGDEEVHARPGPHPGEEGGAYPGGYQAVLHKRGERGLFAHVTQKPVLQSSLQSTLLKLQEPSLLGLAPAAV